MSVSTIKMFKIKLISQKLTVSLPSRGSTLEFLTGSWYPTRTVGLNPGNLFRWYCRSIMLWRYRLRWALGCPMISSNLTGIQTLLSTYCFSLTTSYNSSRPNRTTEDTKLPTHIQSLGYILAHGALSSTLFLCLDSISSKRYIQRLNTFNCSRLFASSVSVTWSGRASSQSSWRHSTALQNLSSI